MVEVAQQAGGGGALPVRKVDMDRPWLWLTRGWQDIRANPVPSLAYGVVMALGGWVLTFGLFWADWTYLILPLAGGFLLMGPLLATGLYEISRRRREGRQIGVVEALGAFGQNGGQIAFMGMILLICYIAWARVASLLFMLYFGLNPPPFETLFAATFLTPANLPFTVIGTLVGGAIALGVFAISALSIPMLLDRPRSNVVQAMLTSVEALRLNPAAMLLWAVLIVVFAAAGLILLYFGLILTLPLIGHATWHAYADLVRGDNDA